MLPLVGFLPPNDERVRSTIAAVERELIEDGLVLRYRPEEKGVDGLPGERGSFFAVLVLAGRLLSPHRAQRGSAPAFRAAARPAQRCRPARRGIRPEGASGCSEIFRKPSPMSAWSIAPRPFPKRPARRTRAPGLKITASFRAGAREVTREPGAAAAISMLQSVSCEIISPGSEIGWRIQPDPLRSFGMARSVFSPALGRGVEPGYAI